MFCVLLALLLCTLLCVLLSFVLALRSPRLLLLRLLSLLIRLPWFPRLLPLRLLLLPFLLLRLPLLLLLLPLCESYPCGCLIVANSVCSDPLSIQPPSCRLALLWPPRHLWSVR